MEAPHAMQQQWQLQYMMHFASDVTAFKASLQRTLQQVATDGGAAFNAAGLNTLSFAGVTQLNFTLLGLVMGSMSPHVLGCNLNFIEQATYTIHLSGKLEEEFFTRMIKKGLYIATCPWLHADATNTVSGMRGKCQMLRGMEPTQALVETAAAGEETLLQQQHKVKDRQAAGMQSAAR
jgi:hypothetical protein